jgi:hypothetical protein
MLKNEYELFISSNRLLDLHKSKKKNFETFELGEVAFFDKKENKIKNRTLKEFMEKARG